MTDYATLDEFKGYLRLDELDTLDDAELQRALTTASSEIDHLCSRTFSAQEDPAVTRWFEPWYDRSAYRWILPVDDLFTVDDLAVELWNPVTSDWDQPVTVPTPTGAGPWTQLVLPDTAPYAPGGQYDNATSVKVTAKFGWPIIPVPVTQACLILAARIVKRRESAFGLVSTLDGSEQTRLTRTIDPDVANALRGYIKYWAVR